MISNFSTRAYERALRRPLATATVIRTPEEIKQRHDAFWADYVKTHIDPSTGHVIEPVSCSLAPGE